MLHPSAQPDLKIWDLFSGRFCPGTYKEDRGEKYPTVDVLIVDDIQHMMDLCIPT